MPGGDLRGVSGRRRGGKALSGDGGKRAIIKFHDRVQPGEGLPALDRDIDIGRVQLDGMTGPSSYDVNAS